MSGAGSQASLIRIVLIGDWVIDENWIVADHRSDISSNVGDAHYRSLITDLDANILSLCGAGYVAKLLHEFSHGNLQPRDNYAATSIYGIGLWSKVDTKALASLLCQHQLANQTAGTLTGIHHRVFVPYESDPYLYGPTTPLCREQEWTHCQLQEIQRNICQEADRLGRVKTGDAGQSLADSLKGIAGELDNPGSETESEISFECCRLLNLNEDSTTTRILRVYGLTGKRDPQLLYRFDWENRGPKIIRPRLDAALRHLPSGEGDQKVDAIIAVDLGKGSVTRELIDELRNKYRNTPWFIRVKTPGHLMNYEKVKPQTRLLLFGPTYVKKHLPTIHRWPVGIRPDYAAIRQLMQYEPLGENLDGACWIVAHHVDNRALALLNNGCETRALAVISNPKPWTVRAGRTTYLFSALIAQMLGIVRYPSTKNAEGDRLDVKILESSLEKTQDQVYLATRDIKTALGEATDKREAVSRSISLLRLLCNPIANEVRESERRFQVQSMAASDIQKEWEAAWDPGRLGTIETRDGTKFFQIWRGMSSINGCIALNSKKRDDMTSLLDACSGFRDNPRPTKSLCSLIIGRPGSGKSYVVGQLARQLEMEHIMFNITHLSSNEELLDSFDNIASRQAASPDRHFMILVDEINAGLEGQPVWGRFLAPISSGVYRRGGHLFQLRPAAWIFSGTEMPGESVDHKQSDKASDFVSRINGPVIDVSVPEEQSDRLLCLEQVYLGMILSRRRYKDLIFTQRKVLEFFYNLKPRYGARSIEYVVDCFTNIQHGELECDNLPERWTLIDRWCQWRTNQSTSDGPDDADDSYEAWLKSAKQKKDRIEVYESPW